jgi:sigma-B regulation protein RsbU (phosphoserine phosphatase)
MEAKKVRLPLQFKISLVLSLLVMGSLSLFVFYSLDVFEKDKKAYIYESAAARVDSTKNDLLHFLDGLNESAEILARVQPSWKDKQEMVNQVFRFAPSLLSFKKGELSYVNESLLERLNLDESSLPTSLDASSGELSLSKRDNLFELTTTAGQVVFAPEKLRAIVSGSRVFSDLLIDKRGNFLLEKQQVKAKFASDLVARSAQNGVFESVIEGKKYINAYTYLPSYGLFLASQVSYDEAFKVASFLKQQSLYFSLVILSLTMIIGILFAKSLTSPLNQLVVNTRGLIENNFQTSLKVRSKDEIGVLAHSFQFMASEIRRYMNEMEEKARLENEIKMAQLVQKSFFPDNELNLGPAHLSAFYQPASECGGDWWGTFNVDNKSVVMVADATGHGASSALITATAHASMTSLKKMIAYDPALVSQPGKILELFNYAISEVGSEVLMTAFVGVFDWETKQLTYANASHNPTLYHSFQSTPVSKNDIKPLLVEQGHRLGHKRGEKYQEGNHTFNSGDVFIFYTDGVLEGTNPEGKDYGKRRFLKSLADNIKSDATSINCEVMANAFHFYADKPLDDDITLLILKVH